MNCKASLCLAAAMLIFSLPSTWAQNLIKANTTSMATNSTLNSGNWLTADPGNGGVAQDPLSSQIGEFDGTVSVNSLANMTLGGANLVVAGLQFDANMNGPLVLGAGNTLFVGASGINMSAANTNVTINAAYRSGTPQTWNVPPNTTLTLNGTVLLDEASSAGNQDPYFPTSAGTQVITITGGGTVNVPNSTLTPNFTGSTTGIANGSSVVINGVTFNGQGITIERNVNLGTTMPSINAPYAPSTTSGFIVNGANTIVTLGTLTIGGAFGNNPAAGNIINGSTTVTGAVTIGATPSNSNPARWGGFEVQGGSFTALDTVNGFQIATSPNGILNPMEVYFAGGVSTIGKMLVGSPLDPASATNETAIFIKGGTLYLGSGGLALGNSSTNNIPYPGTGNVGYLVSLFSGMLGAYTNWSSSLNMVLSSTTGTPFVIETADSNNVPHNITLSGVISDGGSGAPLTVTGGGILTLANTNTFTGITAINGGIVNLGAPEITGVSGPLGNQLANATGTILFGGGTLQYSAVNQNDYSGRFDNGMLGSQPISIDTAGTNVTFASGIQGAGTSLTKIGNGALTLTGASTYDTGTTISGGVLSVNNTSGSGTGSGTVTVGGGGTLGGSGTVAGNVVVNNGGQTLPGSTGPGQTLTIGGNLTYNNGSSAIYDLSASASGLGNDKIVLNGGGSTLTCGSTLTINVTGAALDTHDYVLYSVPSGTISGAFLTVPVLTGTTLSNPQDYSVQKSGNQVILHYTSINPPMITGQTALPSPVQANQNVTFSATVTPGDYAVSSVTANLSPLGGSATTPLTLQSGHLWSTTIAVPTAAFPAIYALGITATDISNNTTTVSVQLTVIGAAGTSETWNGAVFGASPNWSQNGNWTSALAPGFGENIFFAGSTGTTPVLDQSYSLTGVTFNSAASSFTITNNVNNGVLTLTGGATNNSTARQTLNVPMAISSANVTVSDANSAGVILGGIVSGPSGDNLTTSGNVTLNNANIFAGTTVVSSGTLTLSNALALQNSTLNNTGSGTLNFGALTTASIGALSGTKNLSLENAASAPVALNVGGNNTSQTYSGNLTDSGNGASLTVAGTGSLTLSGVNTYSGGTTNGASSTLIIGGAGQLGGGTYLGSIFNNGTFNYQSTAAQTLSGIISGTGPLKDTGLGTLTLSGANSYSGIITIGTGSKLTIGGGGQLGSGNYLQNIADNGTFTYSSTAAQTLSGTISGNGSLIDSGTGTLILNNANPAFTGATTVSASGATLQINNSSALKASVLNLNAGKVTFGNGVTLFNLAGLSGSTNLALVDAGNPVILSISSGSAQTFNGTLTDGGVGSSLSIGGAGQILNGTNTFTGNIGIAAGTLTIGGAGQLGGGNYPGYISPQVGATFTWASSAKQTLSGAPGTAGFEGAGSVKITGTGPLTLATSSALTGAGSITIASNSTFNVVGAAQLLSANYAGAYPQAMSISGTFNYSSSNTTTLAGAISGNGGKINVNSVSNSDTGVFGELSFTSGASTYTNCITTITGGILNYSSDGAAGAVPGSVVTNIFLNGGDLMGTGTVNLNTNRDIGVGLASGAGATTALLDSYSGTFTIGGSIVSAGNTGVISLIVNSQPGSAGNLVLAGTTTCTGNTTIDAGTLSIGDPGSLDNGIYTGSITNGGTFDYSSSTPLTLSGVISDDALIGPGALSVGAFAPASGTNTGTLTLTGTNTFTGGISIGGGGSGGTLVLAGGGQLGAGSYAQNIANFGTLTFSSTAAQTLSAGISGSGALNHNGTGQLTLSGNNNYTGPTTNINGTLALVGNGSSSGVLSQSPVVAVNFPGIIDPTGLTSDASLHIGDNSIGEGTQVLAGNGTVLNNVVVGTSGTLMPGPAIGYGTLTIGNHLAVGAGGSGAAIVLGVNHRITGATNDSVTAASITINPGSTLTINQGTNDLQTGDTFHLFNIAGNNGISSVNNLTTTLPTTGPVSGVSYIWNTSSLAVNGTLVLTHGAPAVSPVNTHPTNILVSVSGGVLQLSWPSDHTGWDLQSNSVSLTLTNDWFTVPGSTSTNKLNIPIGSGKNVYYRMHISNN